MRNLAKLVDKAVSKQVESFVVVTCLLYPFCARQKFLNLWKSELANKNAKKHSLQWQLDPVALPRNQRRAR